MHVRPSASPDIEVWVESDTSTFRIHGHKPRLEMDSSHLQKSWDQENQATSSTTKNISAGLLSHILEINMKFIDGRSGCRQHAIVRNETLFSTMDTTMLIDPACLRSSGFSYGWRLTKSEQAKDLC